MNPLQLLSHRVHNVRLLVEHDALSSTNLVFSFLLAEST
jgi:hypothetical protein